MRQQTIELISAAPGQRQCLTVLHFGPAANAPVGRPKATIQAALHADEVPALLVAQALRRRLTQLESDGQLLGDVQLLPYANPLGLGQHVWGQHQGRFDLRDGVNFNRKHPELADAATAALKGLLGDNALANVALARTALHNAAMALTSQDPAQDLKNKLVQLAITSDVVLDLHCDAEAAVHLYGLTPQAPTCAELGAWLGARAVLLATESGDSPFDEACSRPWFVLQQRFAEHPLPLACFCATLELRGQADTSHALAEQDALAIIEFLRRQGLVAGAPAPLPAALCQPTQLAASEPLHAPCAGVVVFHKNLGDNVLASDCVADVVDIDSGVVRPVCALSAGVLYARVATRWATPGMRLAKIAGSTLQRTGNLLSA